MASWLAVAGVAGSALGGLMGASGAELSGQAQSSADLYQAGIAQINAQLDRQNAAWARQTGENNAAQAGMQGAAQQSAIVAGQGAGNLDVNSGTNKVVQDSQHYVNQLNMTTIRANAAQVAYGYRVQASAQDAQVNADISAASYAKQGADISAGSSILGGATSVASKWLQGSQSGAFSGASSAISGGLSLLGV